MLFLKWLGIVSAIIALSSPVQTTIGGDCQSACQGMQDINSGRTDRRVEREGQREPPQPAQATAERGHHLHPDFAQAQRGYRGCKPHHGAS